MCLIEAATGEHVEIGTTRCFCTFSGGVFDEFGDRINELANLSCRRYFSDSSSRSSGWPLRAAVSSTRGIVINGR